MNEFPLFPASQSLLITAQVHNTDPNPSRTSLPVTSQITRNGPHFRHHSRGTSPLATSARNRLNSCRRWFLADKCWHTCSRSCGSAIIAGESPGLLCCLFYPLGAARSSIQKRVSFLASRTKSFKGISPLWNSQCFALFSDDFYG